jgi:hypothetical protein
MELVDADTVAEIVDKTAGVLAWIPSVDPCSSGEVGWAASSYGAAPADEAAGSAKSSTLTRPSSYVSSSTRRLRAARRSNFRSGCPPGLKDSCCRADGATGPRGRCETSIDAGSSPTAARALIAPFTPESVRTAVRAGVARSAAEVSMMRAARQ